MQLQAPGTPFEGNGGSMPTEAESAVSVSHPAEAGWVDEILLTGPDADCALVLDAPVSRGALRGLVADRQRQLAAAGLRGGGTVALNLPPSLAYVAELLAAWRIGAQVMLLDHRLTAYEVDVALARLDPQLVIRPAGAGAHGGLRTFADVTPSITVRAGRPAATRHILLQLSSGSTGPSKVIGRTSVSLVDEIGRYTLIHGSPERGERIVLLASMVHVLGLVGGLLHGLHTGCPIVLPARLTVDSVFTAIAADDSPATVIGVPFHTELLASAGSPPRLRPLKRMTTGGELVRPAVHDAFTARYGVPLGNMYGMTEVGVIATDLFGEHRPALTPAPGLTVTQSPAGELLIGLPASPYVGDVDPGRFTGGWLHTRDAGSVDPVTGLITVHGRNDSQISIGGLKVDLTEVEQEITALPGVRAAVVTFHHGIEAYVEADDGTDAEGAAAPRLAAYKRPRAWYALDHLPRTTTGKLVRDRSVLRAAADVKERETHA
jgi:acyl-coenzyme A synthetase/AMP-(fatty) acid ligase